MAEIQFGKTGILDRIANTSGAQAKLNEPVNTNSLGKDILDTINTVGNIANTYNKYQANQEAIKAKKESLKRKAEADAKRIQNEKDKAVKKQNQATNMKIKFDYINKVKEMQDLPEQDRRYALNDFIKEQNNKEGLTEDNRLYLQNLTLPAYIKTHNDGKKYDDNLNLNNADIGVDSLIRGGLDPKQAVKQYSLDNNLNIEQVRDAVMVSLDNNIKQMYQHATTKEDIDTVDELAKQMREPYNNPTFRNSKSKSTASKVKNSENLVNNTREQTINNINQQLDTQIAMDSNFDIHPRDFIGIEDYSKKVDERYGADNKTAFNMKINYAKKVDNQNNLISKVYNVSPEKGYDKYKIGLIDGGSKAVKEKIEIYADTAIKNKNWTSLNNIIQNNDKSLLPKIGNTFNKNIINATTDSEIKDGLKDFNAFIHSSPRAGINLSSTMNSTDYSNLYFMNYLVNNNAMTPLQARDTITRRTSDSKTQQELVISGSNKADLLSHARSNYGNPIEYLSIANKYNNLMGGSMDISEVEDAVDSMFDSKQVEIGSSKNKITGLQGINIINEDGFNTEIDNQLVNSNLSVDGNYNYTSFTASDRPSKDGKSIVAGDVYAIITDKDTGADVGVLNLSLAKNNSEDGTTYANDRKNTTFKNNAVMYSEKAIDSFITTAKILTGKESVGDYISNDIQHQLSVNENNMKSWTIKQKAKQEEMKQRIIRANMLNIYRAFGEESSKDLHSDTTKKLYNAMLELDPSNTMSYEEMINFYDNYN